ncbi:uncharacterized protein LOC126718743 [Quercus robur]|uniref:uncharacterized protein LOC126718743 n=1 Tax=Quercus robur TaxID=38942 RepID=UPI0021626299|nr:uncharacterized protein LOC126718743 [Quercus robur]
MREANNPGGNLICTISLLVALTTVQDQLSCCIQLLTNWNKHTLRYVHCIRILELGQNQFILKSKRMLANVRMGLFLVQLQSKGFSCVVMNNQTMMELFVSHQVQTLVPLFK